MKQTLGKLERQLFAYAQMRGLRTLRTGDLTKALGISAKQESKLFTRLSQGGMIAQVRRGLYLVPERLPLGGRWSPDEGLALNTLFDAQKGRYQICGPNAFNRYGLDEQIPNRVYVYNNREWGDRRIGSAALTLIKVADKRLGDTEVAQISEGSKAVYSSRARTLLDAVYDWRVSTLCHEPMSESQRAESQAGDAGRIGCRDVEVRRHWDDPPDGRTAGTRGRREPVAEEARKSAAEDLQPDPLDTDQTKTRHGQPPLGRRDQ